MRRGGAEVCDALTTSALNFTLDKQPIRAGGVQREKDGQCWRQAMDLIGAGTDQPDFTRLVTFRVVDQDQQI